MLLLPALWLFGSYENDKVNPCVDEHTGFPITLLLQ